MKYFIILLERDEKRVHHVENHVKKNIPELEIFKAIDAKTNVLDEMVKNGNFDKTYLKYCLRGQLGVTLSHLSVWNKIVNENISEAVIFEDDAQLTDDFHSKLENILIELPKDYDLLYLFIHPKQYTKVTEKSDYYIKDKTNIVKAYPTFGMVSYILSYSGAKKLIKMFKNIKHNVDLQLMKNIETINAFSVKENIVNTIGQFSLKFDNKLKSNIWGTEKFIK